MKVKFAIKAAAISSGNVLTLPPVASGDIGGRAADIVGHGRFLHHSWSTEMRR